MGTRSLTRWFEEPFGEEAQEIVTMYRQFDGYPEGHGQELCAFLRPFTMVNGIGGGSAGKIANGAGCLAAQGIAHFKGGMAKNTTRDPGTALAGNFYLYPAGSKDCDEDFVYEVRPQGPGKPIRVVVFGIHVGGGAMFDGTVAEFEQRLKQWEKQEEATS